MNKYQEALRAICFGCDDYVIGGPCEPEHCKLYMTMKELIDNHEKYKWHDLRKDPNDLPKNIGKYLVKVGAYGDNKYRMFRYKPCDFGYNEPKNNLWVDEGHTYVYNHFVEAWKYIEEFEDE